MHHALEALEALHEIEDPPLRIGLITALLQALMAAGAIRHASFTAGRLASLQRSLGPDSLRIAPLLAVAAQRVQAERYDAAQVPLEQARAIAREQRDHEALMEASRLAASIHERRGDHAASLLELRQLASHARWLADDLATPAAAQGELIRTELEANALMLRRALDLGRLDPVAAAVRAIERRTRADGGAPLPAELLWDHRVDARVGLFIATGDALARGVAGVDAEDCEDRRREAMQAIDEMPAGHDDRARYWAAYLDDRHAHLLAARGQSAGRARRAARRARAGWEHLGRDEDAARGRALCRRRSRHRRLSPDVQGRPAPSQPPSASSIVVRSTSITACGSVAGSRRRAAARSRRGTRWARTGACRPSPGAATSGDRRQASIPADGTPPRTAPAP